MIIFKYNYTENVIFNNSIIKQNILVDVNTLYNLNYLERAFIFYRIPLMMLKARKY